MNKLAETYYEDLWKGKYNFQKLKEEPETIRRLQNLFATVVNNKNEKNIRTHTMHKSTISYLTEKYKLKGIEIETKRKSNTEFDYIITIQPATFLNNLEKFYQS